MISMAVDLLAEGHATSEELVTAALRRIDETNERLNAYLTVTDQRAVHKAREADTRRRAGETGALLGVPFSVKDNLDTAGIRTTCGARFMYDRVPTSTATAVARLEDAGAILVGKVNLHEFGWGGSTENPHYGATKNPWDLTRNAAGSSGGSGAAVAADTCTISVGTDTGGSVRLPASASGITGLRPTIGRVSNAGAFPLAWSMDTVGPMARRARDVALALEAMQSPRGRHADNSGGPKLDPTGQGDVLEGVRIGWDPGYSTPGCDSGVLNALHAALETFKALGANIVNIDLPETTTAQQAWSIIHLAEPAAVHSDLMRQHAGEYGDDVRALLELGGRIPAAHYLNAQRFRTVLKGKVRSAMTGVDLVALPTAGDIPAELGADPFSVVRHLSGMSDARFYTPFASLLGAPAVTVPVGFSHDLPVGIQLLGRPSSDFALLRFADIVQAQTSWHMQRPPVA